MNSNTPPPDDFERKLAEFSPAHLPAEWKDELLDNALSLAGPKTTRATKTIAFSLFQKASLAGIAACWMMIMALHLSMPVVGTDEPSLLAQDARERTPPQVPLLVRYIEERNALARQF